MRGTVAVPYSSGRISCGILGITEARLPKGLAVARGAQDHRPISKPKSHRGKDGRSVSPRACLQLFDASDSLDRVGAWHPTASPSTRSQGA